MHTIKLIINDSVYDKLLYLLNKFDKNELEIIIDDQGFEDDKRYLEDELDEINSGGSVFMGVEELNVRLEKIIDESENPDEMTKEIFS